MKSGSVLWIGITGVVVSCGGGGSSSNASYPPPAAAVVLAANDLGMHCIDREYSIFSILPPYNVVHAQVVRPNASGLPTLLDANDVDVRYSAVRDPSGSINSSSIGRTDFWQHATALFGANLQLGEGLKGLYMPADAPQPGPQPFTYQAAHGWFAAEGIPITPRDDAGATNPFPMLRITAYDRVGGAELAHTDVVVPVARETDCQNCHASGQIAAVKAGVAWSIDADLEVQTKQNVLLLHDHDEGTALFASQPVLCAACHYSAALDLTGSGPNGEQLGHATMSGAMHEFHGTRVDGQSQPVFPPNGDALSTCYQCHPGAITQCARGAMDASGIECRSCHGAMRSVGGEQPLLAGGSIDGANDGHSRRPWVDMPRCQSCHTGDALTHVSGPSVVLANDGVRLRQAYRVGDSSASPILAQTSNRFAENPGRLFRFSTGHGGLTCEVCHGSTHAEWPTTPLSGNDNATASALQGHNGSLIECSTCHAAGSLGLTTNGPHGMHNVGSGAWVSESHGHFYQQNPSSCKACHGVDLHGTALSRAAKDRSFHVEGHNVSLAKGTAVGCNHCHGTP